MSAILAEADTSERLSATRLSKFHECALAFWFHYVAGVPEGESSEPLQLGTALHSALESAWGSIRDLDTPVPITEEWLMPAYRAAWAAHGGVFETASAYLAGVDMLRAYARRLWHRQPGAKVLGVEVPFEFRIPGAVVTGRMDLVEGWEADGTVMVTDWKSQRAIPSVGEVNEMLQLDVYALAARRLWPWAKRVIVSLDLLRYGKRMNSEREPDRIVEVGEYLSIAASALRERKGREDQVAAWPPTLNAHCSWCSYRTRCQAFKEAGTVGGVNLFDPVAVADAYELVTIRKGAITKQHKDVGASLKAHLVQLGEIRTRTKSYTLGEREERTLDARDLAEVLAKHVGITTIDVLSLLTVDREKVEALIKGLDDDDAAKVKAAIRERESIDLGTSLKTLKLR